MSSFKLQSLTPNLLSRDVNVSVSFYRDNLGFSLMASVPESGKFNWAMVQRDEVSLMFQSQESFDEDLPELMITKGGSPGTFYTKVRGLNELYASLKGKVKIAVAMRTTFYGAREFAIEDPDGYIVMFSEDAG